jgi:hypothetical protein
MLNIAGGVILLGKMYLPSIKQNTDQPDVPPAFQQILKNMQQTQTILNVVSIAFGMSMLMPGVVPGYIIAAILLINGLLIFRLVMIIHKIS